MKLKSLTRAVALSVGAITLSASVAAAQAKLNFEGSAQVADAAGSGGSLLFIDFLTGGSIPGAPSGTVLAIETINGEFDPEITVGTVGVIQDITVSNSGVVGVPIADFLTIGGYTFSIETTASGNVFGPISLFEIGGNTLAAFAVFGTVTGPDFMPPHTYQGAFTAQFAGMTPDEVFTAINSGGTLPVSFSAEFTVGSVVPEPATVVLLGTGIAGLGLFGLRRRNAMQA